MVAYRHISHGFEPVFDERSRVLVLGSFPSEASRQNGFYYGNPRNRFWALVAACTGEPVPQGIDEKKRLLLAHGIALWDTIESCDIKGSADSSIKNVVTADLGRLEAVPIERVVCNGAAAGRLYHRYLEWRLGISAEVLPSTSPANAAWGMERLLPVWKAALVLPGGPAVVAEYDSCAAGEAKEQASSGRAPEGRPSEGRESAGRAPERRASAGRAPTATSWAVHKSMQGNKGKNTSPELLVRERLREAGLTGYRLQWKAPGRPDVAWPGRRVCILVNGCFWHRCPRCNPSMPSKNVEYWQAKFARNVERDARNLAELEAAGWRVHVIWECELKRAEREATFAKLLPELSEELGKPLKG